ncbi:protein phosphatase 1 regulatory inhibitor subunit 14C [Cricetulus griseus]
MSVVTGGGEAAGGAGSSGARVFFQSPRGGTGGSPGSSSGSGSSREDSAPVATVAAAGQVQQQQRRHQQGKVTVKYDRKELRKRLVLEEWIVEQLGQLYGCEVLGHWRGGSGSLSPLCAHPGIFRDSGSRVCAAPALGDRTPERVSERSLSPGCPLALGRSAWDASTWAQLPSTRRASGSLDGVGRGLGLSAFLRVLGACPHSPNYTQWDSEWLSLSACALVEAGEGRALNECSDRGSLDFCGDEEERP